MDDQHIARSGRLVGRWMLAVIALGVTAVAGHAAEWLKITTPYFSVISDAGEDRLRAWATEFELFRRGVEALLPLEPGRLEPAQVVLFASDSGFRAFRPLENGKPLPIEALFQMMPSRPLIALSVAGARDDARTKVYAGATVWYLSGFDRQAPDWLQHGLAEVFGSFNLRGASFEIGINQANHLKRVRASKPMPFAELAAIRGSSLKFGRADMERTERFYGQSWLTVHELLFAPGAPGFPALRRYLNDPGAGEPLAEFEKAVGRTAAEMDARLATHLYSRFADPLRTELDRSAVEAGFELKPAAPAEVDMALGSLLVGIGRAEEAGAYLWRAASVLPDDPRPQAALGEMELALKHRAEAVGHYQQAFTRGARNFFLCFVVADEKLRDQFSTPSLSGLDESDVAEALDLLAQSLARNPRYLPAYEALAAVMCRVDVRQRGAEMKTLLLEGVRRNPRHVELLLAAGFTAARGGQAEEAGEWLQKARQRLETDNARMVRLAQQLEKKIAGGSTTEAKSEAPPTLEASATPASSTPPPSAQHGALARAGELVASGQIYGAQMILEEIKEGDLSPEQKSELARLRKTIGQREKLGMAEGMLNAEQRETSAALLDTILADSPEPEIKAAVEKLLQRARPGK